MHAKVYKTVESVPEIKDDTVFWGFQCFRLVNGKLFFYFLIILAFSAFQFPDTIIEFFKFLKNFH